MLKKVFMLAIVICLGNIAISQSEISSYFLSNTSANLYLNPSNVQDAKISLSLPSFYYVHGSDGAGIYSILKDNIFDIGKIKGKIEENNSLLYGTQLSLFGLYFNYEPISFHIGQNIRSYLKMDFNNLLLDVLLDGNAKYIGESVNIGPYANLNFYNEFYLGFAFKFQNLSLGGRVKKLNGFANLNTPRHEFSIYTHDEIYQLRLNTEYHIHSNLITDSFEFGDYFSQIIPNLTSNDGWAFDFGLKADILETFTISASLLDMGTIRYKKGASKIVTEGSFEFNGLDISEVLLDSSDIFNFDSLGQIVEINKSEESYSAALPVQFYLGLQYYPYENWEFNALFYNAYSAGTSYPSFSVLAKYKPSPYFNTGFGYTWNTFAHFNLSWSAELHAKWFHTFIAMDNIIDIFRPVGGNYFNIRTGIQIDFVP